MTTRSIRSGALRAFALVAMLVTTACGSGTAQSLSAEQLQVTSPPALTGAQLPAFPDYRAASVITPLTQNGSQATQKSSGATVNGTNLVLPGTTNVMQYGVFQFSPAADPTLNYTVNMLNSAGKYFVGISDFTLQRWSITGPFSGDHLVSLSGVNATSANGNAYCFIATFGGATATLQTLTLNVDHTGTAHSIGGHITVGGGPLSGATVNLSGTSASSTSTDASGAYSFAGLLDGAYTITPSKTGYTFAPTSTNKTLAGADISGVDFVGSSGTTYFISGTIKDSTNAAMSGVTVALTGSASQQTTTAADGTFTFTSLSNGSYTVTPTEATWTFTPPYQAVNITSGNKTGVNFSGTQSSGGGHLVSGKVTDGGGDPVVGVKVDLNPSQGTATTDATGTWKFSNVADGIYSAVPEAGPTNFTFKPANIAITVSGADSTGNNFLNIPHYSTGNHEIQDLITANCSPCHTTDNPPSGGIHMTPYTSAKNNANSANIAIQAGIMPQGGPLSAKLKAMFKAWNDNSTPQ